MSTAFGVGSVSFVGPPQVPALQEFHYARLLSIDGRSAQVTLIDPDGLDSDFAEPADIDVLRRRRVDDHEMNSLPGTFVVHPVAFVQPDGNSMDQWAYGVVTGYHMIEAEPWLHVRLPEGACKIVLEQPYNVVTVDWFNYVLQTGARTNSASLNLIELKEKRKYMSGLCSRSRTGSSFLCEVTKLLYVPFNPAAEVPVIRPDTLEAVKVPRYHMIDCSLNNISKKGANMFVPSSSDDGQHEHQPSRKRKAVSHPVARATLRPKMVEDFLTENSKEELIPVLNSGDEEDVRVVQQENQFLVDGGLGVRQPLADDRGLPEIDEVRGRSGTTFRPTTIEQQCNHSPQKSRFCASPPVLRAAWDFGFHIGGQSVTHLARVTRNMLVNDKKDAINMSDFSRKNTLHLAPSSPTFPELLQSLDNLRQFGRSFYNADTVDVLDGNSTFYREIW